MKIGQLIHVVIIIGAILLLQSILGAQMMKLELPTGSKEDCMEVVKRIQQKLAELDYHPGQPDGQLGPSTSSAIKEFEKKVGLRETGRISEDLLVYLYAMTLPLRKEERTGGLSGWIGSFNLRSDSKDSDSLIYHCKYEYFTSDTSDMLFVGSTPELCYFAIRYDVADGLKSFALEDLILARVFGQCPQLWKKKSK